MENNTFLVINNIGFGILVAGAFYFFPYIAWCTMDGDKTDILMGMVFGVIPIGLLLLSVLYGLFTRKIVMPICIGSVLSIPAIFIPIVGGDTIIERLLSFVFIFAAIFVIVGTGTVLGIFLRQSPQIINHLIRRK